MLDLPAIKKRCEAATDGPWLAVPLQELAVAGNFMVTWRVIASTKQGVMKQIRQEADAEFAAHARSDLPAALEALEEAQGRCKLLEKGIRFLLMRIERVESERDGAIRHERVFREQLTILGESE
ncbi:hypothetical protein LCGC14_2492840 [marine sediment metagenome]|uniref:Uncharacterized protein n=1 Tax=marine sediment metagenome TaxID=412755 RepID=A0A0F9DG46_9ZZZZ